MKKQQTSYIITYYRKPNSLAKFPALFPAPNSCIYLFFIWTQKLQLAPNPIPLLFIVGSSMNSREATLAATATVIGALASAIGFRFFYRSQTHAKSSLNGTVFSPRDPFDPSKRKG